MTGDILIGTEWMFGANWFGEHDASPALIRHQPIESCDLDEGGGDGEARGIGGVRLPIQGGVDRRLRRRKIQPSLPLHPQPLLPRLQVHHRRRIRYPHSPGLPLSNPLRSWRDFLFDLLGSVILSQLVLLRFDFQVIFVFSTISELLTSIEVKS